MIVSTKPPPLTAALANNLYLRQNQNLADLDSISAARGNLGLGTAALANSVDFATAAQGAKADTALQPAAIGVTVQGYDPTLAALAGLVGTTDKVPFFTGADTAALADLTPFGRSLIDDANAATARTTLELGTIAIQNANAVAITGGSITGLSTFNTNSDIGIRSAADSRYGIFLDDTQTLSGTLRAGQRISIFHAMVSGNSRSWGLSIASTTANIGDAEDIYGIRADVTVGNTGATGLAVGVGNTVSMSSAGAIGAFYGGLYTAKINGGIAGSVTTFVCSEAQLEIGGGSTTNVTNAFFIRASNFISGAAIGTLYGLSLPNITQGSTNYGIYTNSGPNRLGDQLHTLLTDAATNALSMVGRFTHNSSGTPVAGFGPSIELGGESGTGGSDDQNMARWFALWNVATHASRVADVILDAAYSGGWSEILRGRAGATPAIAFLGGTPQSPQTYTQTYATADRTLAAYTSDPESSVYTGIDNAQGGTPYAQLTDLNALRTAYENLRAFVEDGIQMLNALIDDMQGFKLAN